MLAPVNLTARLHETTRLFAEVARNADLRRLLLAWATSNLASRASAIAVAVYAYDAGGASAVGVIVFVRLTAGAVFAPWLSVLADRKPRRLVLIGVELVRCSVFAALTALVVVDAAPIAVYVLAVLVVVAEPLFRSAQAALTPALVSTPEELTAANVLASGVESVGLFLGPALGALLLAATGVALVFGATAGLLVVTILLVASIGVAGEPSPETGDTGRVRSLLAGWRTIAEDPGLRVVVGLFSLQTLVAGMFNVLVVVLAIEVLDLGTPGVGLLDGVVGIGAVAGVVLVAGVAGRNRLATSFGVGLLLWGVPLALVAATSETALVVLLLLLVGIGNTLVDVTGITLLQRSAPDAVLGRVFGAFEALIIMTMGIGSLLAPILIAWVGTRGALLAAGLILPIALLPLWRPLQRIDAAAPAPAEAVELLGRVPMFAPLPAPELERLALAVVDVHVVAGTAVFGQGDGGDRFYVIREGTAEVEIDARPVRKLSAGDFFGEIALVRDVPRTATVRALTPLVLAALERDVFVATLTHHPASAEAVGSIVAARLPVPVIP
jgi:MFS family permease